MISEYIFRAIDIPRILGARKRRHSSHSVVDVPNAQ